MRLLRRGATTPLPSAPSSFGPWLLRHFARGEPTGEMPFARLEQVCSNAGSVLCGAAYADASALLPGPLVSQPVAAEAALLSKRTGDGFRACLEDRQHTVITWPWDHLATRVAWEATQSGDASEETVGRRLCEVGAAYAVRHRAQLSAVFDLWEQVASGLKTSAPAPATPSLVQMGTQLLAAFEAEQAAS